MAKISKKKTALLILEIVVLLLFIAVLYVYGQVSSRMDKIEQPVLEEERIVFNEQAPQMTGYDTYALFAVDSRKKDDALVAQNSDTIIVASVNNDTKDVKLVSIYRDTLMNIGGGEYTKANAAYAYGGPEQAISMLNTSLDLNITDYATVDFDAMTTIVDLLGGLDIPMSYAEIEHMNNYCVETSKETGKSYTPIEKPEPAPEDQEAILGTYHLNGVQVTSYCRIRYTANLDMGRTERQRRVIQMIVDKAKTAGLTTIFSIMDEVFPMVQTSLTKNEILQLIPAMLGYKLDETTGFPINYKFAKVDQMELIVPTTLEANVSELHKFLYGKEGYVPGFEVVNASNRILEIAGSGEAMTDTMPQGETTDDTGTYIWSDDGNGGTSYEEYNPGYDNGYTEPDYSEDYTEPDYSGGDYTEPESGGGDYTEPDYSGGDYTEPESGGGDYTEPESGGGDYTEPESGDGDYTEPESGGGDYTEPEGGGDYTEPESGSDYTEGDTGYSEGDGTGTSGEAGY